MSNVNVGSVRPSQLLWTYGPGALIDLPNLSVITMGINKWETNRCIPVDEARLLTAVRRILGPQVERLRIPPASNQEGLNPSSAEALIGVPVTPFPRWLRCVRCGLLSEYDSGLFDIRENRYRPERTKFIHTNCEKGANSDAVPARFLLACRNGHLDDFPWHWFVHSGPSNCSGTLRFFESGASLQTENLWVKCDSCQTSRSMAFAFGRDGRQNLPACRGRHPHLGEFDDECQEDPRAVLLGATNSWFPVSISVLAIPTQTNQIQQIILDGWEYFHDAEDKAELKTVIKTLVKSGSLPGIDRYPLDELWVALEDRRNDRVSDSTVSEGELKGPEWDVLTSDSPPSDWPHFLGRRITPPEEYKDYFENVVLLERLREVNALLGYTRVEAPEESSNPEESAPMASISSTPPSWVPASEVHGEGIFIKFKEEILKKWEEKVEVISRSESLLEGHKGWRNSRRLDPNTGYPGIRYVMLHTFAHLLIRELALECGYNAASIRERVYSTIGDKEMGGVLIYTAAADSDGTLGGLVQLGNPERLGQLIDQALSRSTVCSSDPLCSEHNAAEDRSLHMATCHACGFVAETSCEKGNRYLDRSLLVKTFDCSEAAFFNV